MTARPLTSIALILAIFATVFLVVPIGGAWGMYFLIAAVIVGLSGQLTGR